MDIWYFDMINRPFNETVRGRLPGTCLFFLGHEVKLHKYPRR